MNWICDHFLQNSIVQFFDISSALKERNFDFLTGPLHHGYKQRLKALDMPSVNDVSTQVVIKSFIKFLRTTNTHYSVH